MSGPQTKKKKTVAQWRAEKEQRQRDFCEGSRLVDEVREALNHIRVLPTSIDVCYSQFNALLGPANRALKLLQSHPDTTEYILIFSMKAEIHRQLGQYNLAVATYQQADEA